MGLQIAVPRESVEGERRVAAVPETVSRLSALGARVAVESSAGAAAGFADDAYREAGAEIVADGGALWANADVLVKVAAPSAEEIARLRSGTTLLSFVNPLGEPQRARELAERGVTTFAMELIPRISRAQSMDALSSMSTIAGYKAVLLAAVQLPKLFPLLMTAAGTIAPARVLVLGAGVAGLQAIATARRLGAVVSAFDTRAVVKEQVESLGATFLALELPTRDAEAAGGYARALTHEEEQQERALVAKAVAASDVVITTALVPGKRAPVLITDETLRTMRPGSVIVDLAAEAGGNCEGAVPGQSAVLHGVTVIAPLNVPSGVPTHASQLYARNVANLLALIVKDGALRLDFEDEVVRGTCLTHDGRVLHAATAALLQTTEEKG
ncbi:MAG TPA: Re/Si-specific NAD(P)(+) transhydrogenase subunit alpha [Candidatus Dormibacteraeota bacterium]|nr:Re/Si-specific NAD(P)(+) transhydrogenase subunit alpha [Candidatus Dormibacteraeota bacterium]